MTVATTFTVLLVVASIGVGFRSDRSGVVILNALFLATLAGIAVIVLGLGNASDTAISAIRTFAFIIASFCVPMTLAYYLTNTSRVQAGIAELSSMWPTRQHAS
mgnify:CR=1 FL=1